MTLNKCPVCDKTAYPLEANKYNEKLYHKACFKCAVCQKALNMGTVQSDQGILYCKIHLPKEHKSAGADNMSIKSALAAPKKGSEGLGNVQKQDKKVAPQLSNDFSVNIASDQSTENQPTEDYGQEQPQEQQQEYQQEYVDENAQYEQQYDENQY